MLSDEEFSKLLENYDYSYKIGKIVNGLVVSVENNMLLVDINSKANAICPASEVILSRGQTLKDCFKVGETYEFAINREEDEDGVFYLSNKKVQLSKNISLIEEKFKNDEIITGEVTNIVKGGVIVSVLGLKGFVPLSQLNANEDEIGKEISLKILSLDLEKNNFILSNKKATEANLENIRKEIFNQIEVNMVVKGTVVRITDFGAFIDIGGIDGLLPLSKISWGWIEKPSDVLKLGQKLDVEIIGIEKDKQRISLSLKSLEESPWEKAKEVVQEGKQVKGIIKRIKPFGAFVEVYPLVEGLLSKSQLNQYYAKTKKELNENDEINLTINRFDIENEKISFDILYE